MTEILRVGGDSAVVRAPSALTGGALFAYEVALAPGGGPPHLHRHAATELVRVDEGELTVYRASPGCAVERRVARPGEVVVIGGSEEHTLRNESSQPVRALAVLTPGAAMESFAHAAAAAGDDLDAIAVAAAENGIEITRPLGSAGHAPDAHTEDAHPC